MIRLSSPELSSMYEDILKHTKVKDDPAFVKQLIDLFLEEAVEKMEHFKQAIAQNDIKLLSMAAHTLKTSSAYLGLSRFSSLCTETEKLAHSETITPEIRELVNQVEEEFARKHKALLKISEQL